jgi:hypothetical protein|tara:strand:- start:1259 stop:1453 length:195 start_codon:yes stop_codon:yes gene_type:complete
MVVWQATGIMGQDGEMFFPTKNEAVSYVRENGDLEDIRDAEYHKIVVNNRRDLADQLNLAMGFG